MIVGIIFFLKSPSGFFCLEFTFNYLLVSEKYDIIHVGETFFIILMGNSPHSKEKFWNVVSKLWSIFDAAIINKTSFSSTFPFLKAK